MTAGEAKAAQRADGHATQGAVVEEHPALAAPRLIAQSTCATAHLRPVHGFGPGAHQARQLAYLRQRVQRGRGGGRHVSEAE